jgi:hypothetical protein
MITIHWDFTDGTEVSYIEGRNLKDNFTTHCLEFFNMDEPVDDVVVIKKDGSKIGRKDIQQHSPEKEIRKEHNIHKMIISGSFEWKK